MSKLKELFDFKAHFKPVCVRAPCGSKFEMTTRLIRVPGGSTRPLESRIEPKLWWRWWGSWAPKPFLGC